MYACENLSLSHELLNLKYSNFLIKFVSSKCYMQKVALQKSSGPFFFFWNPTFNVPNWFNYLWNTYLVLLK
jgi:hypothetical protein